MQATTSFVFLAVSTFVYFSCSITTVYGKCSGRWAIHACYGGNGKRSGPTPDTGSRQNDRQYILRQLLLRDRIPTISDEVSLNDSPIIDDMDSILPDIQQQYERKQELNDIKEALSDLLLSRRFRDSTSEDLDYKR